MRRWKRVLRNLRQHGVGWTADRVVSALHERLFDWWYGIDTVTWLSLDHLHITGTNAAAGKPYEPTRLRMVRRLLSALRLPPNSALVDFGCGKGRVLLLAAHYGFRRVTGVEFAAELCKIAVDNVARYCRTARVSAEIRVIEGDAVTYDIQDDENVFFLANPFGEALVDKVLDNIVCSTARAPRQVFVVYSNPRFGRTVERHGFRVFRDINSGECIIYTNRELANNCD
jgi:SAM-dependent methyltransferase